MEATPRKTARSLLTAPFPLQVEKLASPEDFYIGVVGSNYYYGEWEGALNDAKNRIFLLKLVRNIFINCRSPPILHHGRAERRRPPLERRRRLGHQFPGNCQVI